MEEKRKIYGLIIGIIAFVAVIASLTYAYLSFTAINNTTVNATASCVNINYTKGSDIDASEIEIVDSFNSIDTSTYGVKTELTFNKTNTCTTAVEGIISIYTNPTTSSTLYSGIGNHGILRYTIVKNTATPQTFTGYITNTGDTDVSVGLLESSSTTYTVYLWLEEDTTGTITIDTVSEATYSGYVHASSFQTSTNNYTVNFDANGGNVSLKKKIVELGNTYGNLPEPTRDGYSFLGWSYLTGDYEQVEYIESSGTQYIDTLYYWQNENIEIYFDGTVLSNPTNQSLFGSEEYITSSGYTRNFAGIPHGNSGTYSIYLGSGSTRSISTTVGTRFTLDIKTTSNKIYSYYLNGSLVGTPTSYSGSVLTKDTAYLSSNAYTNYGNIYIFSNHNSSRGASNGVIQNISSMRLYAFKMYDNNVLVRDFVPCYNTLTEKAGLCDRVNDTFYGNPGSEDFSYGSLTYITASTVVSIEKSHTLTAIWQEN